MEPKVLRTGLLVTVLIGALAGAGVWWRMRQVTGAAAQAEGRYADPAVCAECHPDIAATYQKTGMGRSFRRIRTLKDIDWPAPGKPWHHAASDTFFEMVQRDGSWFQRRWQIGFDGKETNVDEKSVDYVLGSGNHAKTFLHLTEKGTLQELPLGWYAEKGGYWAMNPGYDRPDYAGSVRPIYYECMACHNGYPKIPEGERRDVNQATYLQPLPEGIDCQRCHGPGQNHVDRAYEGAAAQVVRAAIVNPARLSPDRQMEVCLQCHLETSNEKLPHAIVRFDRQPFSYVPGQPLDGYELIFDRAQGNLNNFEVAQAGYRLRESQCFFKSEGKLRCTSCHNPHDIPRGRAGHGSLQPGLSRLPPKFDSIGYIINVWPTYERRPTALVAICPSGAPTTAVHVVMTEHLISRRPPPGDLLADKPERAESQPYQGEVVPYYPAKLSSRGLRRRTMS